MNQVTVFNPESVAITYTDKKGNEHGITAEGALYKGGAALQSLKDAALSSALSKATAGRYRAAADILTAAFPKAGKAAGVVLGNTAVWANKRSFGVLIAASLNQSEPEKGWNKKQSDARLLLASIVKLPAFAAEPVEAEVVEAQ